MARNQGRILFLALCVLWGEALAAQTETLLIERRGDHISASAPQLHFLSGRTMEKLRNGSSVVFVMTLIASPAHGGKSLFAAREKLAISYDLWEEKLSIVQNKPGGHYISHLTSEMAESWFLENVKIPVRSIPNREPFVVRFECRIEENDTEDNGDHRSPLTIAGLVDAFGRKKPEEPLKWEASTGPVRLGDLKK